MLNTVLNTLGLGRPRTPPPPMLDGPWAPNDALETAAPVAAMPGMDCVVADRAGNLHVSSQTTIHRLSKDGEPVAWATFDAAVTAMAAGPSGIVAAIEGVGLVRLDEAGNTVARLDLASRCVTAIAVDPRDEVYFAIGSATCPAGEWYRDLMDKGAGGSLHKWAGPGGAVRIAGDLAFPAGLAFDAGGGLLVSEAWRHRILRLRPSGGAPEVLAANLPGYPGRISAMRDGYLLSVFAMRTLLVDFVLTEDAFRTEMIETIDPEYWIRPSLYSGTSYLEPLQGGAIVKLGVKKAWSPPRSYGLVVALDANGVPTASWHSRVGGRFHGVTSAIERGDDLFVVSKGADTLLRLEKTI